MINKGLIFCLVLVATLFLSFGVSSADLIYDTGAGDNVYWGYALYHDQWLGKMISFSSDHFITQIDGWMNIDRGGDLRARIYADSDNNFLPDTILYTSTETLTQTPGMPEWKSFDVNNFQVYGNTNYWFFFEADINGASGNMPYGANHPDSLPHGWTNGGNFYYDYNLEHMGFRVYGDGNAVVPEPASLSLLGLGLLGFIFKRRKW